tara:strand:+ start:401 stop:670 length:270 start_codon:yes stop_codon:yes gene_type:complete
MRKILVLTLVALVALSSCEKEEEVQVEEQEELCRKVMSKKRRWDNGTYFVLIVADPNQEGTQFGYARTQDVIVSESVYLSHDLNDMYCE